MKPKHGVDKALALLKAMDLGPDVAEAAAKEIAAMMLDPGADGGAVTAIFQKFMPKEELDTMVKTLAKSVKTMKPVLMMGKDGLTEVLAPVVTIHGVDPAGEGAETVSVQHPASGSYSGTWNGSLKASDIEALTGKPKGFLQIIKDKKAANVIAHGGYTVVFTDGGCQTNSPNIGAWAYTVTRPGQPPITGVGHLGDTTNNRMELMAIYRALEELEIGPPIKLYADSMYAINCATLWGPTWMKKGWITADGKPVKNRDLITPIVQLVKLHTVDFIHVKGHGDVGGNLYVDSLCTSAISKAHHLWLKDAGAIQLDPGIGS